MLPYAMFVVGLSGGSHVICSAYVAGLQEVEEAKFFSSA